MVGAGPAGAWTAYELARRGARVLVFDASHPREKPCGGGVTRRALARVAHAVDLASLPATAIRSARFVDSSRRGEAVSAVRASSRDAVVPLGGDDLIVTSRAAFDAALLDAAQKAGARLCAERVLDVRVDTGGVEINTARGAHRGAFLVGADGANSLVRRRVAKPFRRDQLSIATGFFARGITSGEVVVELVDNPPGYLWSFPRLDHLAIGICGPADVGQGSADLRARTAEWIRTTQVANGAPLDAYAWPIPSLSASDLATAAPAGTRWCLVGDAAGLVDPITREGIFFAIESGAYAADALSRASPHDYVARLRDEMMPELARAARFKAGFFRPAFMRLLVRALRESEGIRRVMIDLIAGTQSYRALKWRLLKTLEGRLAWRMLMADG